MALKKFRYRKNGGPLVEVTASLPYQIPGITRTDNVEVEGISDVVTNIGEGAPLWVLRGDLSAPALFQADYATSRYWRDDQLVELDGTFSRASDAWHLLSGTYTKVTANQPRVSSAGLLIERQVANQSSVVSGASMLTADTNATRSAGSNGLDGATPSCLVTSSVASGYSQRSFAISADKARRWVGASVKKTAIAAQSSLLIVLQGGTTVNSNLVIDTLTGLLISGAGKVIDAGTHWIVWVTVVANNNTSFLARFVPAQGVTGSAEAWGLQMVTDPGEPTSLILTGSYTRVKEVYSHNLAGLTTGSPRSWMVEWGTSALPVSGARGYLLCLSDGTANNRVAVFLGSNGFINLEIIAGGVVQALITGDKRKTAGGRLAFAYGANDAVLYVEGTQIGVDASVTLPTGIATLNHGADQAGNGQFDGYIVREACFAGRQENDTLAALSYLAPAEPFANILTQWFSGNLSGKKLVFTGDSTTQVAAEMFTAITTNYTSPSDGILAGVNVLNRGESGKTLQDFLATTAMGYDLEAMIAEQADLYVFGFGINDARQGARTEAQMRTDMISAINQLRAGVPKADIVLWGPASFLSTDVGGNGFVVPNENAQLYSTRLYNVYQSLTGYWPNVAVLQKQDGVYGRVSPASSTLMADQIHPGPGGRRADAVQVGRSVGRLRT